MVCVCLVLLSKLWGLMGKVQSGGSSLSRGGLQSAATMSRGQLPF